VSAHKETTMARATNTKKPRNKDSSKFKDAVDASAEADKRTGVEHDDSGPVYVEKLSLEERASAGEKLGEKNIELRELEQSGRDAAAAQRKKVKALKKTIATLSDEAFEGVRKRPAQASLPGTAT
jgi:hypothetical protein